MPALLWGQTLLLPLSLHEPWRAAAEWGSISPSPGSSLAPGPAPAPALLPTPGHCPVEAPVPQHQGDAPTVGTDPAQGQRGPLHPTELAQPGELQEPVLAARGPVRTRPASSRQTCWRHIQRFQGSSSPAPPSQQPQAPHGHTCQLRGSHGRAHAAAGTAAGLCPSSLEQP